MRRIINQVSQHPLIAERPMVKQFFKFGLVGAMNTSIDYLGFAALITWTHIPYLLANVMTFSVAATNSYILNRRWTFRNNDPRWQRQAAAFFTVMIVGLTLNSGILFYLVDHAHLHKLLAKAIGIVIVLFWNFFASRFLVFRGTSASLPG